MSHDTALAAAIVDAHAERFGTVAAPPAIFQSAHPVYRAAKQACLTLGFIAADAECLAGAWHAQTVRNGRFDAGAWPTIPVDFGMGRFPPGDRSDAFAPCPARLGLYAVVPDAAWVARMARAGVPTVQLRFKSTDPACIDREVTAAVRAVRTTRSRLFINDHWEAALASGAYGVHLGQEDLGALPDDALPRLRAAGLRLGVSTHGHAEMVRADMVSPSYIAMGAVFPTTLKQMATAPQGLARLAAYARLLRGYPQVAIGGIDAERLRAVLATGVGSVAMVRALLAADDPDAAAAQLSAAVAAAEPLAETDANPDAALPR